MPQGGKPKPPLGNPYIGAQKRAASAATPAQRAAGQKAVARQVAQMPKRGAKRAR